MWPKQTSALPQKDCLDPDLWRASFISSHFHFKYAITEWNGQPRPTAAMECIDKLLTNLVNKLQPV